MDRKQTGRRNPQIVQAARRMRTEPTPAERVLWNELRGNRLCGVPLRRQYPVDRFVLDSYCASRKLAIEVDGEIHDGQQEQDRARTEALALRGIRVIRFRNDEVLNHLESVLQRLRTEMNKARTWAAASSPPLPLAGEGGRGEGDSPRHQPFP